MARYRNAIWRPTNKHGYAGNDTHLHQGLVIHSAEGSLAGLFSVLDGSRQASWHFSVAQDGKVYQHIDTDRIAWTNGSQQANTKFWGIECEGGGPGNRGEPLTEPQYQSLAGVVWWLWEIHGLTRYERQRTLWEHNEMTRFDAAATSCPSGRIPWDRLIMESQEDDDMDRAQFDKWWGENWGKFVADAPADVPDPIGHLNRYLRGGYPRLQNNVAAAASKGGVLEKVILRLKVLEQLRNPCNFGTDHATMSERMGQYRTAIKALQQEVAALEAGGPHDHEATVNVKLS